MLSGNCLAQRKRRVGDRSRPRRGAARVSLFVRVARSPRFPRRVPAKHTMPKTREDAETTHRKHAMPKVAKTPQQRHGPRGGHEVVPNLFISRRSAGDVRGPAAAARHRRNRRMRLQISFPGQVPLPRGARAGQRKREDRPPAPAGREFYREGARRGQAGARSLQGRHLPVGDRDHRLPAHAPARPRRLGRRRARARPRGAPCAFPREEFLAACEATRRGGEAHQASGGAASHEASSVGIVTRNVGRVR